MWPFSIHQLTINYNPIQFAANSSLAAYMARRVREIGIRMALGADRSDLIKLILRQGAWIGIFGLTMGTGAALLSTHALSSMLFDVEPLIRVSSLRC